MTKDQRLDFNDLCKTCDQVDYGKRRKEADFQHNCEDLVERTRNHGHQSEQQEGLEHGINDREKGYSC